MLTRVELAAGGREGDMLRQSPLHTKEQLLYKVSGSTAVTGFFTNL